MIDGILLLDKPAGYTSNQALQKVKRLFQAAKAGHGGSLDPLATGLLPIYFGKSTKEAHRLLHADKEYLVGMQLGVKTDTGDITGNIIEERAVNNMDAALIRTVLSSLLGKSEQIPPMFSAVKHKGKPLYKYARAGVIIDRAPRVIEIKAIELISIDNNNVIFTVHCSKGTYVRTLVEQIGDLLGCGATVAALRRTKAGFYTADQMVMLATIEELAQFDKSKLNKLLIQH